MKASEDQISGNHYKNYPIQPAEFIQRNGLNWCEGNAIKYLVRHRDKKGAEDLLKAKHYIDLLLEWEYSTPLPAGEGYSPLVKDATADSLCLSCGRDPGCIGDYPRTKEGGCEGYLKAETGVHISEWYAKEAKSSLRDRMLDAKESERTPSLCFSCHQPDNCAYNQITSCEDTGKCDRYMPEEPEVRPKETEGLCATCQKTRPECGNSTVGGVVTYCIRWVDAKQEAPTAAEQPLDFTLPSIALKCTAEEAKAKFESEVEEYRATKEGSMAELIERWDCYHALRTYYERGGNVEWYQDVVRFIMEDISKWFAEGRPVMQAKRAMLIKNAARAMYSDEDNAAILATV